MKLAAGAQEGNMEEQTFKNKRSAAIDIAGVRGSLSWCAVGSLRTGWEEEVCLTVGSLGDRTLPDVHCSI